MVVFRPARAGYRPAYAAFSRAVLRLSVEHGCAWHINADETEALDYCDENADGLFGPDPYRSSEHDPVSSS